MSRYVPETDPPELKRLRLEADDVVETSCASVILKGEEAFKVKKPVDFGFLDFTTLEKRRDALSKELAYNRRTAPHIYRHVDEIGGEPVLVMRRFDKSQVMAELSLASGWEPSPDLLDRISETIARFHAGSERIYDREHGFNTHFTLTTNHKNITLFREALGAADVDDYGARMEAAYERLRPKLEARFTEGWVRRCHGDLHLGNILIENGAPVLFDCIEFNERLIQIDILYDLAFILMDLWVRGHEVAANRVMNVWLEAAARQGEDRGGLYGGLELLPLYLAIRAGVRCHVKAHEGGEDNLKAARAYLKAGLAFLEPHAATAVAVGGLSGSGKSTHARGMASGLGRPCGAVVLRSDEIRKRQWNCPSLERLPPEAYATEASDRVYGEMHALGGVVLKAGQSVIFDATFRDAQRRSEVTAHVEALGFGVEGVWLDVPLEVRLERVAARTNDVSDATTDTVRAQDDMPAPADWRALRPGT